MAPSSFHFSPYEPAYANTIAQVLGLPAQIQAQSARNIAEATARANALRMQASGQKAQAITGAVNQAIGNVGDILQLKREAPIRALQLQDLQNRVQANSNELLTADRANRAHAKLSQLVQANKNPDGTLNHQAIVSAMQADPDLQLLTDEYVKQASASESLLHPKLEIVPENSRAIDPRTNQVVVAPVVKKPNTEAEMMFDAADLNSPTQAQSAAALKISEAAKQRQQAEVERHNKETERISGLNAGREAASAAETARHNKVMEANSNPLTMLSGPAGSTSAPMSVDVHGDAFLKSLPSDLAGEIKAFAEGRRPFPTGMSMWRLEPLIKLVGQYDPTFDAANYNARNKARTDLTSPNGMGGKTINALNTALQHAGKLSDLIEALDNAGSPLVNAVVNPIRTATGSTAVTNYNAVAPQLAKEIERAWRGAGGSTKDIEQLISSIGKNLGKQQQREALQQFVDLAKGKLDATQQQRDNVLGPAGASIPVLFDQNKAILAKIEQRAGGTTAATPAVGAEGTVNGRQAIWRTGDKGTGWYAK